MQKCVVVDAAYPVPPAVIVLTRIHVPALVFDSRAVLANCQYSRPIPHPESQSEMRVLVPLPNPIHANMSSGVPLPLPET